MADLYTASRISLTEARTAYRYAESVLTDLGSCVEAPKEAEAGGDGS